jgi:hypothetical protein
MSEKKNQTLHSPPLISFAEEGRAKDALREAEWQTAMWSQLASLLADLRPCAG